MGLRTITVLAAALLAAAPALAQQYDPERFEEQTPEEIAAIAALNRVQIERSQEAAARQAVRDAEAAAQAQAYQRELDYNQQLWFDFEMRMREQMQTEADYDRALQNYARIQAACRMGNFTVCEDAWRAQGLIPPPRPNQQSAAPRGPRTR